MHLKRNKMPIVWPIRRKGTKYIAVASHSRTKSIPVLFILRDMLGLVQTRKEAKYFVLNGNVKINNKIRKDEKFPVLFFDTLSFEKTKKNYRLEIVNKKYKLKEISDAEANKKIVKIIGKKIIDKNKIQMNLEDGQNFFMKEKFALGDSVIVDTKQNKVEKILELKIGAKLLIIGGKHLGESGKLKEIIPFEREKKYKIQLKDKEVILPGKTFLVVD
ncbi:MAG: S4 domain-containing protein [Nanoarchaeota archaeon]|nr:S4 domain-containing protein [Nanoarchaeota archaeon]